MFQSNPLFRVHGSKALQIVLYQDEFEVCNPLGQGKGKHKILAVYFTLGNLHASSRSKVDPKQLLLLCKDKFFNDGTICNLFRPLLLDISLLETEGVDLGFEEKIKCTVSCITDKNLGSHWLGGFTTNFSNGDFFCSFFFVKTLKQMHLQAKL